jgi:acetyltransferase-like isoleucine patch superfamily enzyme
MGPAEPDPDGWGEAAASVDAAAETAAAKAGIARADVIGAEALGHLGPGPRLPLPPSRVRWGWRAALRFALRHGMYTPRYVRLYARYAAHRAQSPHIDLQGMVFLGRRVLLEAQPGHGRLSIGPWAWIGDGNKLRSHEGNLRLGPKVVTGYENSVNSYLDIEIGENALLSDWIYICDFDHGYERVDMPIKKQGLATSPVRVGEDVWVGEKVTILRGSDVGSGSVIASQTVVKDRIPPFSIVAGAPGRVVGSRLPEGMTAEEALALQHSGQAIPGDPLEG